MEELTAEDLMKVLERCPLDTKIRVVVWEDLGHYLTKPAKVHFSSIDGKRVLIVNDH